MELRLANRTIYNLLEIAALKDEYIRTLINHRKIGKTSALVQFAKDNGYFVLVGSTAIAKFLIREHDYKNIRTVNSIALDGIPGFVFDECCPIDRINQLKEKGFNIVTGFVKDEDFYATVCNCGKLK
ncbi:hypothetical protein [Siminovitchia sp. FSL W7-1587]|uniref:hypothetical protein n=1 Tax=Siminovitchia sp. FSL W7-1587 TaxID=2954699 RepID=UPI0030D10C16